MKKCVFCSIAKENKPYHDIIFNNDKHLAFLDIKPTKYGHVLVIPKKHIDFLFDLNEKDYVSLLKDARKIALCIKKVLNCKHVYLLVKGFRVKHVHVHLIPVNINNIGHLPRMKKVNKKNIERIGMIFRKSINLKI